MSSYRVDFQFDPHAADEVQFRCPFHGKDAKPSARLYNRTQSCFCWVCRKSWDIVSFTIEMEGMKFAQSLNHLTHKYHIDTSSVPNEVTIKPPEVKVSKTNIEMIHLSRQINSLKRKIDFEKYRKLCVAFYMLKYSAYQKHSITEGISKVQEKLDKIIASLG